MSASDLRHEHDSLGTVPVPRDALWGAQTQRAVENFPISGLVMPRGLIRALALIKLCAARVNADLGVLDPARAAAIEAAARAVADGEHDGAFPVDVFQTGSGTSTNMNANEVIARLAERALGEAVHPNDHVNRSQSSNDTIPSAIHISAATALSETLLPGLARLSTVIRERSAEIGGVVKTGRTHLMDAMPLTLGQELGAWAAQVDSCSTRLGEASRRLRALPQGGTAVGTGVNAPAGFAERVVAALARETGLALEVAENRFALMAAQDTAVEVSGQLNVTATALLKIANDLRWMNSGPLAGLGEIELPAVQPGSSIMPGKVNPVIPESVAMVCAQVTGNHLTVTLAGQAGSFQLNTMLPVIGYNLLQSIELLGRAARNLADRAIAGMRVRRERVEDALARNPILVTALANRIGYDAAAAIAKEAYREGRTVLDVAAARTDLDRETLRTLLDPRALTG